jgi:hypothetical protein
MPESLKAKNPFQFINCVELSEILGKKTWDEQELLESIEDAPLDSIYYHLMSAFLRHKYISGPYPNDFATWAAIEVRDRILGERLGVVDPYEFDSLEDLRGEIVTIIDDHLSKLRHTPRVLYGEPFYFMRSRIIEIPSPLQAWTLSDFIECLREIDVGVIFFHFFEARRRGRRQTDFATWFEEGLGRPDLAQKVLEIHPYMSSLEGIREKVLEICAEGVA